MAPRSDSNAPVRLNFLIAGDAYIWGGVSGRAGDSFDLIGLAWQVRRGAGL